MKRDQLLKLLAGTGADLPEPRPWFQREEIVWATLLIVHSALLLGLVDLAVRLIKT